MIMIIIIIIIMIIKIIMIAMIIIIIIIMNITIITEGLPLPGHAVLGHVQEAGPPAQRVRAAERHRLGT